MRCVEDRVRTGALGSRGLYFTLQTVLTRSLLL